MSRPEFKVHNKTDTPVSVSVWVYPISSEAVKPSWYQCVGKDEVHHFKHCVAGTSYVVKSLVSPDNEPHPEWNWKFPGLTEYLGLLEDGFRMWHDGDLDYAEIKSFEIDEQNNLFSDSTMSSSIHAPSFNQTITVALNGGPAVTDMDKDRKVDGSYHIVTADFLKSSD